MAPLLGAPSSCMMMLLTLGSRTASSLRVMHNKEVDSENAVPMNEHYLQHYSASEAAAGGSSRPPTFDNQGIHALLQQMVQTEAAECAQPVDVAVEVPSQDVLGTFLNDLIYLEGKNGGRQYLAAKSKRTFEHESGKSNIHRGQELKTVKCIEGNFHEVPVGQNFLEFLLHAQEEVDHREFPCKKFEFVFDGGLDSTQCWGELVDFEGSPVCGKDKMQAALAELEGVDKFSATDMAGSRHTTVAFLQGFVVRNLRDQAEYDTIKKSMKHIGDSVLQRSSAQGSCHTSGLSPICAVLNGPGHTQWVFMRKVETALPSKHFGTVDMISLKGPAWGQSTANGRTAALYASGKKMQSSQDYGFTQLFPDGAQLIQCGSRAAATALRNDAKALELEGFTNYPLFGVFYKPRGTCSCAGKPRWPMLLEIDDKKYGRMTMAVGVIDYFHSATAQASGTTMTPAQYRLEWQKMWGSYFHFSPFLTEQRQDGSWQLVNGRIAPEIFRQGCKVESIARAKFLMKGLFPGTCLNALERDRTEVCWAQDDQNIASAAMTKNLHIVVEPGSTGTIVEQMHIDSVGDVFLVNWDEKHRHGEQAAGKFYAMKAGDLLSLGCP